MLRRQVMGADPAQFIFDGHTIEIHLNSSDARYRIDGKRWRNVRNRDVIRWRGSRGQHTVEIETDGSARITRYIVKDGIRWGRIVLGLLLICRKRGRLCGNAFPSRLIMTLNVDPHRGASYRVPLLVIVLLITAFLRFHALDAQSFWNDEGNSARIAERPVSAIIEGAAGDIHTAGLLSRASGLGVD